MFKLLPNFCSFVAALAFVTGTTDCRFARGADLDGNGQLDIVAANFGAKSISAIVQQPEDQTVIVGGSCLLSVTAVGNGPLLYQWRFNGTNLSGATDQALALADVQLGQAGAYSVEVRNEIGSILSREAIITVLSGPGVLTNPDQQTLQSYLDAGIPVTFGFRGTMLLTNALWIRKNALLDGTGTSIVLDGSNTARHFISTNGARLRLINLTLVNGRDKGATGATNQNGTPGLGGSIYVSDGTLELIGCRFTGNSVQGGDGGTATLCPLCVDSFTQGAPGYGGAIYLSNAVLQATNCIFTDNVCLGGQGRSAAIYTAAGAPAFGGAIYASLSAATLDQVTFTNNSVQGGDLWGSRAAGGGGVSRGGAVALAGGATAFIDCHLESNRALGTTQSMMASGSGSADGGAVFLADGFLSITRSVLQKNSSAGGQGVNRGGLEAEAGQANGGAVYNRSGNLEIRESAFVSNQATGGPGYGSSMGFINNGGQGRGGAICNLGALSVINSTFADNRASGGPQLGSTISKGGSGYGGAILTSDGSAFLLNVTVAGNSVDFGDPSGGEALGSSIAVVNTGKLALTNSILFCLAGETNVYGSVTDGGHNLSSDSSAGFTLVSSINNIDPLLTRLGNHGGRTPTVGLSPRSPAVDRGDTTVSPPIDQRGVPRPQGSASDIGAFELAPELTVFATNGSVMVQNAFLPDKTNLLMGSFNLVDWEVLQQKPSDAAGVTQFEDTAARQFPRRFYQVRTFAAPGP